MSTFIKPGALLPLTKARSVDINDLSDAVEAAFDLLPSEQAINAGTVTYATDNSVSANVYVISLANPPSAYTDGMEVRFTPKFSSSGPSSINVNGLGVVAIKSIDGNDIQYEIYQNLPVTLSYSSANGWFYVESSSATAAINAAAAAAASAAAAAASAAQSINAADVIATSTTSIVVGTGIKNFTIQPAKQFQVNMPVRLAVSASLGVFMDGYIRSYNSTTGAVSILSQRNEGTGTYTAWTLMLGGPVVAEAFQGGGSYANYIGLAGAAVMGSGAAKLQRASLASGGYFQLPDPDDLPTGYQLFELSNYSDSTYSGDAAITDISGNHLAYLAPNRSTDVHLGESNTYIFPEASPVGKPLRFIATASVRIAGTAGSFLRMVQLDSDRMLFIAYGTSMHAVVYQISTNTWGSLTLIRTTWAGTGAVDNVMAKLIGTDQVIIASCPENTTTLQVVLLTMSGLTVTPGTAQATASTAAAARLLDIVIAGTSYVIGYVTSANVPRAQARTVSGTTVSAPGTEVAGIASTPPPIMLDGPSTTFAIVTGSSSGFNMTTTPYTVTGTTIATGTASAAAGSSNLLRAIKSTTSRWIVFYINGATARATAVDFIGTAISYASTVSFGSTLNTTTSISVQKYGQDSQIAMTGTDSAGGFATDFTALHDPGTGGLVPTGPIITRYSPAAQTVAPAGTNYLGAAGNVIGSWTISTTKNTEVHSFIDFGPGLTFLTNKSYRLGAMSVSGGLPPLTIYPKRQHHNSVLYKEGTLIFSTLGDGTKPALYSSTGTDLGTMRTTPPLINDPINGAKSDDNKSVWIPYSMGTDAILTIEQVRIA